jgi:hypothetical protein
MTAAHVAGLPVRSMPVHYYQAGWSPCGWTVQAAPMHDATSDPAKVTCEHCKQRMATGTPTASHGAPVVHRS